MTYSEFKLLFPKALIDGPSIFEKLQNEASRLISRQFFAESYDFVLGLMTAHIGDIVNSDGGYSQVTAQSVGAISQTYATLDGSLLSRTRYGSMILEIIESRGGIGVTWVGAGDV